MRPVAERCVETDLEWRAVDGDIVESEGPVRSTHMFTVRSTYDIDVAGE